MTSIESDDDDFLASPEEEALPSPRKSLKRLKKRAAGKSEAHESLGSAASSPKHSFDPNTDPSFNSNPNPNPSPNPGLGEFQSTGPLRSLCTTIGPDDAARHDYSLQDLNVEVGPDSEEESDPGLPSNAEQEDHEDLDPTLDGEQRSDSEEDSESDEEVDEDDEIAVLNLLEKRRKSTNSSPDAATAVTPPQTASASAEGHEATEKKIGKRKIKSAELEEMHATSQRLLRETSHASFKPQVSTGKSISSVLEKIRLRKLQLAQGLEHRSMPFLQQVGGAVTSEGRDEELLPSKDIWSHAEYAVEVEDVCTQEDEGLETVQSAVHKNVEEDVDVVNTPERHADGGNSDVMASATLVKSGNALRAPMEDTQDLLSNSQSSHEDLEEDNTLGTEEDDMHCASRVDLHFDTETQDNFEHWPDEDSNKENLVPSPSERTVPVQVAKGPSVRALIDDEAEDEDEDVLVPGDDEEADEGEDVEDMVIEENNEKAHDIEKRAELHRKWLEQQDAVMTDDILLRLKTGWRPRENRKRGLEFLDEEVDMFTKQDMGVLKQVVDNTQLEAGLQGFSELPDENSQDMEASRDEDCPDDEHRAFKALEDFDDVHESSDDEETEKRMMRQRFLQESEEQGDLMSPADDETSREVFVLINKVNIATTNKKLKPGFVDSRYLGGGTSNSNSSFTSKSSFLRRTASSTLSSVQRQGSSSGSGTRSFIFGRDDSNSSHSLDQQVQVDMEIKENLEPSSQGLRKESSETRQVGKARSNPKTTKASSSRLGPSLFEILRRQSTDLGHSLQKNFDEASHNISPIFAAFKPIKSTTSRTPRGA